MLLLNFIKKITYFLKNKRNVNLSKIKSWLAPTYPVLNPEVWFFRFVFMYDEFVRFLESVVRIVEDEGWFVLSYPTIYYHPFYTFLLCLLYTFHLWFFLIIMLDLPFAFQLGIDLCFKDPAFRLFTHIFIFYASVITSLPWAPRYLNFHFYLFSTIRCFFLIAYGQAIWYLPYFLCEYLFF